jgi:hypothetical protein
MSKAELGIMAFVVLISLAVSCYATESCETEFQQYEKASINADNAKRDADADKRHMNHYENTTMHDAQTELANANRELENSERLHREETDATVRCYEAHKKDLPVKGPSKCSSQERKEATALEKVEKAKANKKSAEEKVAAATKEDKKTDKKAFDDNEKANDLAKEKEKKKNVYDECIKKRNEGGSMRPDPEGEKPKPQRLHA